MKDETVVADLIFWGSTFHNFGAAMLKALSPYEAIAALGSTRRLADDDLSDLDGL